MSPNDWLNIWCKMCELVQSHMPIGNPVRLWKCTKCGEYNQAKEREQDEEQSSS